jgi:hypothetical protein
MNFLTKTAIAAASLTSVLVLGAEPVERNLPGMKSATSLEAGKELFHLRPDPYASLIDSKDHIQLPAAGPDGKVEFSAQAAGSPGFSDVWAPTLGSRGEIERRDQRLLGLVELARLGGGKPELLPERQITEAFPTVTLHRTGTGFDRSTVAAHLLSGTVPPRIPSAELYPLNSSSPDQMAEIEDRFAVALRFIPADDAMTRRVEQILGPSPSAWTASSAGSGRRKPVASLPRHWRKKFRLCADKRPAAR